MSPIWQNSRGILQNSKGIILCDRCPCGPKPIAIYWLPPGGVGGVRIKSADLDGGNVTTILSGSGGRSNLELGPDYAYYTTAGGQIWRCPIDGGTEENFVNLLSTNEGDALGLSITKLNGGRLFWGTNNATGTGTAEVGHARLSDGGDHVTIDSAPWDDGYGYLPAYYKSRVYYVVAVGTSRRQLWRAELDGSNKTMLVDHAAVSSGVFSASFISINPVIDPLKKRLWGTLFDASVPTSGVGHVDLAGGDLQMVVAGGVMGDIDYVNERVYYRTSNTMRRINYDGTGDTLVANESFLDMQVRFQG